MAKLKTQRLSKAEAEQIRMSKNFDKKDEEAKAVISKLGFRSFFDSLPKQSTGKKWTETAEEKAKSKTSVKR